MKGAPSGAPFAFNGFVSSPDGGIKHHRHMIRFAAGLLFASLTRTIEQDALKVFRGQYDSTLTLRLEG